MSKSKQKTTDDWPAILFALIAIPLAFTFGGVWVGIAVIVIGVVALGWRKRHDGPFPTNRPEE